MMEATQMICDSILESDEEQHEEEEEKNDRGEPLCKLCILKNDHIPEKEYLLYLGDNVLGRDPNTCSLPFLAPSVSKQHAVISLSVYRRKGSKDEVEALLWDLGSMNGTRKGRLKLTPNVRYALSEGDSVVVADIPCKYTRCSAEADARTPENNRRNTKASAALRENADCLSTGKTKSSVAFTKSTDPLADSGVTQGTPVRTAALSLEQTPIQQQHESLVPDSEPESDEEKSRVGDKRQKAIVSDSDCYKSSPTCSTFTSPTNKVVPESEDESPITPSSSYKNRTRRVSFNTEESDIDGHGQEREKTAALEIVGDSEEETGSDEANACTKANVVAQFNMDSDTDVEEEEEKQTTTAPPVLSINVPKIQPDSDTDVEEDQPNKPPIVSNGIPKNSQVNLAAQAKGISVDSDTDVEEEAQKLATVAPPVSLSSAQASNAVEFNMDSDTDVEDEELMSAASEKPTGQESANSAVAGEQASPSDFNLDSDTDVEEGEAEVKNVETPSGSDAKPVVSEPAAPVVVRFDSDTEDEDMLSAAVEPERPDLEILSNSDTDVEDDFPAIQPSTTESDVAKGHTDGEAVLDQGEKETPAAVTGDSDTDLEEAEVTEKRDNQVPVLQREITPDIQGALLQNCSTPIQQPEGNVAEMETQPFLSPSVSSYRQGNVAEMETQPFLSPSVSSYRRAVSAIKPISSGLDYQDQDLVVAETQSFIVNDRGHDTLPEENLNVSSDLESSVNGKDVSEASGGHFQLELSDSSVLRAQALAMESTQAFVDMNLETQPYAEAIADGGSEGPVDVALQATQAYIPQPSSDEESGDDQAAGKDDQSVPHSSHEHGSEEEQEEATQSVDYISVAPTQPMCFDEDGDGEDSAPVLSKRKAKPIEEEETQQIASVTAAQTQPVEIKDDSSSDGEAPVCGKEMEEAETQPNSDLTVAETQPMEMMEDSASDEELQGFGKKKEEAETQPNSDLTVAPTQPMEMTEDPASDEDSPVFRKRKAKQLHLEEEATQAFENPKDGDSDEDLSIHNFRKKKVKRLERIEDTQPSEELTVSPTQPLPSTETEEDSEEDSGKLVGKRQTPETFPLAPTLPVEDASDEEEEISAPRSRKARKLEDTQSLMDSRADTKDAEKSPSRGEVSERPRRGARSVNGGRETAEHGAETKKRQTRGKSNVVSKGRRGRGKVEQEDESDTEETETDGKDVENGRQVKQEDKEIAENLQREEKQRKEREETARLEKERVENEAMAARIQKEKQEKENLEREEREREEKENREKEEMERLEREREEKELEAKRQKEKMEREKEEKERKEKEQKEKKEMEKREKERVEKERELKAKRQEENEEMERREKERIEKELAAKCQKEKEEKERMEQEKKEREEKERNEKKRMEKERLEKEKAELASKRQKEKEEKERREREEKERLEKERIDKELEAKRQKEKEEKEKMEREEMEKERVEKEKKELAAKRKKDKEEKKEKEMLEKSQREKERKEQREEAKKAKEELQRQEEEKKRLGKERQTELDETKEEAPRRGRRAARRTIAVPDSSTAAEEDGGPARRTRSRSNSSNSVCSERSLSSVGSQTNRGRGRGRRKTEEVPAEKTPARGRRRTAATVEVSALSASEVSANSISSQGRGKPRGRGRTTESEDASQESSQKATQRGRRSMRICSEEDKEDKGQTAPSVSTRGQGGAKDQGTRTSPEDEKEASQEEASTSRRGGRKRPAETQSEEKTQEKKEPESRKTSARNTQTRKSMKAEEQEEEKAATGQKPKGKNQRKKSEEQEDSSMEQDVNPKEQEPPQTPRSSVSRKRQSADSESDPVAKTSRSSTASPATVGRSRASSQSYKVLFTGVVDEAGEKVLSRLGGSLAKDVADMNCLVTDKVRRTVKFLCAVAKGIPIVTTQWLEKSGKAKTLLSPEGYLVKDREQENKFDFNLQDSLRVASEQPLLQGYQIHVTKSVKPEPVHMKDIITSSGAVFLPRMPSSPKTKTLVISCEEDWSLCAPAVSCSIPVLSAEFILTGILQQRVDLETHQLSGPASAPGGRGRGRKKT